MRKCRQCNWENPAHAAFCTNCGTALEATRPPQPQLGDWTLAAGDGSLSGQLKASAVTDTPTRSLTGDSSDLPMPAQVETPSKTETPALDSVGSGDEGPGQGESEKPSLASALSDALELGSDAEVTAASFPAHGSSISDARTLVDMKMPDEAVLGSGQGVSSTKEASATDADSVEESAHDDDHDEGHPRTGSFVSMALPTGEDTPESDEPATVSDMPEVPPLSSKAPGLIRPPEDIAATATIDLDGDFESPAMEETEAPLVGSTAASIDLEAVEQESVDIPIESLDGDDSLAGLSHSLMRPTITGAMGPDDLEDAQELGSVDLESIERLPRAQFIKDHLTKMPSSSNGEIRTPVGTPRFVLRQLGATEKGHRSLTLSEEGLVIGRSEGEVVLEHDPYISPRHATLGIQNGEVEATDLGSLNGVWVRARREATLKAGDQVMLGEQIFRIEEISTETGPVKDGAGTRRVGTRLRRSPFGIVLLGWDGLAIGRWVIPEHGCRVGRYAGELVFNDDQLLSATHGLFVPRSNGVVLKDLDSANGCWVRAQNQVRLMVGDAVMIGRTVWRLGQAGTTRSTTGPAAS